MARSKARSRADVMPRSWCDGTSHDGCGLRPAA
jgi:hypothetical protein